jgi:hypothetical protein
MLPKSVGCDLSHRRCATLPSCRRPQPRYFDAPQIRRVRFIAPPVRNSPELPAFTTPSRQFLPIGRARVPARRLAGGGGGGARTAGSTYRPIVHNPVASTSLVAKLHFANASAPQLCCAQQAHTSARPHTAVAGLPTEPHPHPPIRSLCPFGPFSHFFPPHPPCPLCPLWQENVQCYTPFL